MTKTDQDEVGKLLDKALIELEHCKNSGDINNTKIKALEDRGKALEDNLTLYKSIAEDYKTAAHERREANEIDTKRVALYEQRIASYEQSIKDYKEEVARLRAERDARRRGRNILILAAAVVGAAIGYALGNK